jgi:hypothetical protein
MNALAEEIAAAAARLVVEEGMEYGPAKAKAARGLGRRSGRRAELPGNEQVEDAVREHLALFHARTQPAELRALRELALHWMERLQAFRPHVVGAVWRGTATRLSALHLDLYCDDAKATEIELINAGLRFDADHLDRPGAEPLLVLTLSVPCRALGEPVTMHLSVHDRDDERGALRPDARGQSWRGDRAALQRLLVAGEGEGEGAARGTDATP